MTDSELRDCIRQSQESGCRALFDTYFHYVYAIVHHILRDCAGREDVEECVMDVFMDVVRHFDTEHEGSVKAYIGTAAKRRAIDRYRTITSNGRHTVAMETEQLCTLPDRLRVEQSVESTEQNRILLTCVRALGEPDASIIIQKYFYDRNAAEIARVLGLSAAAVRMRCSRAMKRLEKLLSEKGITL